jgi:radical SAM superfamily enzyme YgiQ (UPF0313 family)
VRWDRAPYTVGLFDLGNKTLRTLRFALPSCRRRLIYFAMPDIVLSTLNAKYIHAAFGLRYLLANMGPLQPRTCLAEFDINQRPLDIVEAILALNPKIIGFGIYIWNVAETTEVVTTLKRVRPGIIIVLGGPEVSYEVDQQRIVELADYVITGEADLKFGQVCGALLAGDKPPARVIPAELPQFDHLVLPYDLYDDKDVAHRVIYVEASRGCPFTCEFCLSSLDIPVRQAPLDDLLRHLQRLLDRGVRQFKFVDRTFNLNINVSKTLLQFFLERYRPELFLHFEMIPDRLPEALRELIARFPPGALQFEVGVQSFNDEVCRLISRRQDTRKLEDNFRFLRRETGVHIHADLIVGLPGESLESFGAGFDRLVGLNPHEIQVGILKRLRGTPIVRHDAEWRMLYNPDAPYEILQTRLVPFSEMQRMRRFARYWDLVGNSGNFVESAPLLWRGKVTSPFAAFMQFSEWLYDKVGRTDSIALVRLAELLFNYLTKEADLDEKFTAEVIWRDYQRGPRHDLPEFLRGHITPESAPDRKSRRARSGLQRQARHWNQPGPVISK